MNRQTQLQGWSQAVKDAADNMCVICGSTNRLESHHIMPRHLYPEFELDLDNGLCLCHNCHYLYHNGKYASNGDKWEGIQIPNKEEYERVKDFRDNCAFVLLPLGTIDRIKAIGEEPNDFILRAVLSRLEDYEHKQLDSRD